MTGTERIEIRVLGQFSIRRASSTPSKTVTAPLGPDRRNALAYLAIAHPLPVTREALLNSVRNGNVAGVREKWMNEVLNDVCIYLREALDLPRRPLPIWNKNAESVRLVLGDDVYVDYAEFNKLVDSGTKAVPFARDAATKESAWTRLRDALDLVRPLNQQLLIALHGSEPGERIERSVRGKIADALKACGALALDLGRSAEVRDDLEWLFEHCPCDDNVALLLAKAHSDCSDRDGARRVLAELWREQEREGIVPSPAAQQLDVELRAGSHRIERVASAPAIDGGLFAESLRPIEARSPIQVRVEFRPPPGSRRPCVGSSSGSGSGLVGTWLQVTYPDDDPDMTGSPWSIEWAVVEAADQDGPIRRYHSLWYRIWETQIGKKWSASLSQGGELLLGDHQVVDSTGPYQGQFQLVHESADLYSGSYQPIRLATGGAYRKILDFSTYGYMVWARTTSEYAETFRSRIGAVALETLHEALPADVFADVTAFLNR